MMKLNDRNEFMAQFDGNHSADIEQAIRWLEMLYDERVTSELEKIKKRNEDYAEKHPDHDAIEGYKLDLVDIISRNRSGWSSGFSTKNMCEQITRQCAVQELERLMRGF